LRITYFLPLGCHIWVLLLCRDVVMCRSIDDDDDDDGRNCAAV